MHNYKYFRNIDFYYFKYCNSGRKTDACMKSAMILVGKGYVNTENCQMVSIGAVFTSTYHKKQLNPWPNSSASLVNYSWLLACQGDMEPFEEHPSSCGRLTSLRNMPQQKQPRQLSAPIPDKIVS